MTKENGHQDSPTIFNVEMPLVPSVLIELLTLVKSLVGNECGDLSPEQISEIASQISIGIPDVAGLQAALDQLQSNIDSSGGGTGLTTEQLSAIGSIAAIQAQIATLQNAPAPQDGADGAVGPAGQDGAVGQDGMIGPVGPAGQDGADGVGGSLSRTASGGATISHDGAGTSAPTFVDDGSGGGVLMSNGNNVISVSGTFTSNNGAYSLTHDTGSGIVNGEVYFAATGFAPIARSPAFASATEHRWAGLTGSADHHFIWSF